MSAPNPFADPRPPVLPGHTRLRAVPGGHVDRAGDREHAHDLAEHRAGEHRLRAVAQQVADRIPQLADAVASLVELAEEQDEPRLQRFAALTRSRTDAVMSLARGLEAAIAEVPAEPQPAPHPTDLRAVVTRVVRAVRAEAGAVDVRAEVGDRPLLVRCDAAAAERSIAHLLWTALHHSERDRTVVLRLTEVATYGAHGAPTGRPATAGRLTVAAEDSPVTTRELARIVSRFHHALDEEPAGQPAEPARIGVSADGVTVESGSVHGEASRDGGLVVHADWPVESGSLAVIPGRRQR